ncbi:MAG: InlB B-repeat-containing protein [Planctomycetota bacterium]|jgi:hypothetical protein
MKKEQNTRLIGFWAAILAFLSVLFVWPNIAYCQTDGCALLLQQTPVEGGTITPSLGVHHFDLYSEVTITAVAKPGFQFVYWLGDVSDTTANSTIVYLDSPKIIIAVFERAEFELLAPSERSQSINRGGLTPSAGDYARRGGGGAVRRETRRLHRPIPPEPPEPPEPSEEDFPVPPEGNDFPVPEPIPEPATVFLLGLGSLALLRKCRGQ